ncbi:MAG TPA: helix-turn-helix transcriptional regulator [Acetobacteraceae bacterium]|nr:helix-turn-helix transcriptional regulator [Acetobacteraceae bacterium]
MRSFRLLRTATDRFLSAAIAGGGWDEPLEHLAAATGSTGGLLASYWYPSRKAEATRIIAAVPSKGLADGLAAFLAGKSPPCSRLRRVKLDLMAGFRVDHDDYTDKELAHDPFYQDFLRPYDAFWNATGQLGSGTGSVSVEISLKRDFDRGPYQPYERSMLNAVLPDLRAAVRITQGTLDAEATGIAGILHRGDNPVFELDSWGNVRRAHGFDPSDPDCPVRLFQQRLATTDLAAQSTLDSAVAKATAPPRASAIAPFIGHNGCRYCLQIVPVTGPARDVFAATVAVAVLLALPRKPSQIDLRPGALLDAFCLTDREAAVAVLLAEGLSLEDVACRLDIQIGTVRNYLKSLFEKTGTHRQAQLVALLVRLQPYR